jgi:hypothetical protein
MTGDDWFMFGLFIAMFGGMALIAHITRPVKGDPRGKWWTKNPS